VNSPVHLIEKQLDNVNDYPNWQDNCDYAKVIEQQSPNVQYERYYTDTPWPITDRDLVMKMVKEKNKNGSIKYIRTNAPDKFPLDKDFMRIQEAGGEWLLEPLSEHQSKLTYQFYADPGGSLPAWLVNSFIVQGPYNTFSNLKKLVEQ
jgi:regulatory protein YycH of two-component signal transduction system YycFG